MHLKNCGFLLSAIAASSFAFSACSASNPNDSTEEISATSSSNDVAASSSSANSSQAPISSSNPDSPNTSPFETWHGSLEMFTINTGYDNGTNTSGYWFYYSDYELGGASTIDWPVETDFGAGTNDGMDPVILHCNGVCGTATYRKESLTAGTPFIGLGFYIAGEKSPTDNTLTQVDASAMGGVCVTYTSDNDINLKLGIGKEEEEKYDYNIPTKTLPKSKTPLTQNIAWADFKQLSEGNGKKISGEEAAKILAMLKFEIPCEDKTTAEFNIMSVGPYNGNCHQ